MRTTEKHPFRSYPPSSEAESFLRAYTEILEMLVASRPTEEIFNEIALLIERLSPVEAWCSIVRSEGDPPKLELAAAPSIPDGFIGSLRDLSLAPEDGTCGQAIVTGDTVIVDDILADPAYEKFHSLSRESGIKTSWTVPVFCSANKIIAVVTVYYHETRRPSDNEVRQVEDLRHLISLTIEKTVAADKLIQSNRYQAKEETTRDAIVKVAKTVSSSRGEDFHHDLTANMVESLGADGGLIGRVDTDSQSVSTLSFILDGVRQDNLTYSLHDTPCENATTKDVCLYDRGIQDLFPKDHALIDMGMDSYAGIALFGNDGNQTGILSVLFKKPIEDASLVTHVLTIFAERAASELERHDADARILEQASLLDKARDAIFTHDMRHRINFWNKSAERLYGHPKSAAITRSARELLQANTEGYDLAHSHTLEHGEWIGELHQIDKDGKALIVESRWNLVRDRAGDPTSILTINTDVTGHRHLEQQFLRAQRLDSIGTLAGGLAHDLNNVLAPISMSIELLRSSVNDTRGNELLDTIARSSQRGAGMIAQILSFARGMEGRRTRVSGNEIISELTGIIRDTFPKSIRIEARLDPELWPVLGDATQLHQVLLNLCVNARDAMPEGGDLFITASNNTLAEEHVSSNIDARTGPYVCIQVKDTGKGIPPEIIGKIYDPFFTTKEVGKGTGLGLSTTLTIVKTHGGFINSYSEPGNGSNFKVYLPAMVERPVVESDPSPEPEPEKGDGENILVIDDEDAILEMTAEILRNFGYQPLTASSGEEAVSIYREKHDEIDLVITDMMMPGMGGAETIERLLEIKPRSRVIAVSGIRVHKEIAQGKFPGLSHFIQKPYSANTLLKVLSMALKNTPRNWF